MPNYYYMSLVVVDRSPLVIYWFDWIVLLGWLWAKRGLILFQAWLALSRQFRGWLSLDWKNIIIHWDSRTVVVKVYIRLEVINWLTCRVCLLYSFITIVAINYSSQRGFALSEPDWLIDFLIREAGRSIIWLDYLRMCLLVRFDLGLFWLDHQGILNCHFWLVNLWPGLIIWLIFGFRALNHSKNHPTVGHQGFIIQFIELIIPTHFKCCIGLEGTVELFGLISSSKPNVAHL
jgi:hypothetical protein